MDRRTFLTASMAAGIAAVPGKEARSADRNITGKTKMLDLSTIPNFCSHEHWGSISSIEPAPGGWRADMVAGARPKRRTTLVDLIIEPYFDGWLHASGTNMNEVIKQALGSDIFKMAANSPVKTMQAMRPALRDHQLTGIYQCTRRGILAAYGFDIDSDDPAGIISTDKTVGQNYGDVFSWYRKIMKQAHFSKLIRPVHPEFFTQKDSAKSAAEELAFTNTIMRIDPFMDLWKTDSPRRDTLAKIAGVQPQDAKTWRQFLDAIFDLAEKNKTTGIKQLQAYSRPLKFETRTDSEVKFTGDLTGDQVRIFQDWVMHECCKRANDRSWPHQIHVGTHNLGQSGPLPLQQLSVRYPDQKIVMLHCWPFLDEAGHLAKQFSNIYIDTCWQPVLNPQFFRQAMSTWLNYVPFSKIMLGNDATSIEMAIGSSMFTRQTLAEVLVEVSRNGDLNEKQLRQIAADMFHNNAVRIYKIGKEVTV